MIFPDFLCSYLLNHLYFYWWYFMWTGRYHWDVAYLFWFVQYCAGWGCDWCRIFDWNFGRRETRHFFSPRRCHMTNRFRCTIQSMVRNCPTQCELYRQFTVFILKRGSRLPSLAFQRLVDFLAVVWARPMCECSKIRFLVEFHVGIDVKSRSEPWLWSLWFVGILQGKFPGCCSAQIFSHSEDNWIEMNSLNRD